MVLIEDVDEEQENEAQAAQWRRIQVVEEDSDDADGAAQPSLRVWSDPCPDLEISCSVAGAEDAKSRGNRLFGDGKLAECERWFTKALWLYESGKVQDFPGDLRCALQTNRALCRLKLQRFQDAEQDCSAALEEKPTNGKARYRRALARFEQGKLIPGLQDAARAVQDLPADSRDEAQQLKTRIEEHLKAGTGGGGQLGGNESNASKENSYRKIPIREVDKAAVPASAKSPAPAPKPAASAPAPGFKRMEIVEASDSEEEQADSAKAPTPTPAKPASAKSPAPAPKPAASAPAPGFKRMEIVEASDSEDEEPRKPSEPKPAMAEVNGLNEYGSQEELHPDIQVEPTMAGAEKAKQRANELFQKGQLDESVRWFSKAIWLLESGKIAGANGTFRSVLYSNRAFARSKMQQWALVEEDANQALSSNEKNAKALYRRAHARLELKKLDAALQDVDLLIPMLASPSDKEALELKQRILEQKAQSELFTREEVEAAKDAGSKLFSQQDLHGAVEQFTKALRMLDSFQVLEAESDPSWASSTRGALFSNRALVNLRLEQWQASEEDCTESLKFNPQGVKAFYRRAMAREKLNRVDDALKDTEEALRLQPNAEELLALQRRLQALKPKVETPRGFKRMEIVEASEEEEEEEEVVAEAKPNEAAIEAPAEPFADIELEHTVAGAEKAKDMGNKLFQEGKIQECERWFSKAIWLVEESGKVSAPDTLRGILHSNRAFARLRMQRWSSAELDCDEALQLNGKNPKCLACGGFPPWQRRSAAMEATAETVEERLRDLQDRGLLGDDELDDHAQAALRKADPDIAMEALAQWERSSHKRRNPSACMVSLLKKLNDQGSDIGQRGAVEPDVAATQQAEDLMARLGDKIDSSANRALRDLEPTEALSILTDMVNAGDTIRNHSAFVMSATKRFKDQARSSGSRRRDPPRLQQGPYADHQDGGCGYGGFGYDTENVYSHDRSYDNDQDEGPDNYRSYGSRYNGRSREDDSGYRRDRSYDNDRDENDYPSYSSRYNERGREDDDSGYRYDQRSRSGGYDRGYSGYRESHDYYDGGDRGDRRNRIEELIDGLNVDTGAREALGEIPEGKQVMLLEELTEDAHKVRNHSAFIISNVKRIKDGTYYPRKRETSYEDRSSHGQDYSYSYNCYVSHSGSYEREDREMRDDRGQREDRDNDNGYHDREQKAWSSTNDLWDSLDAKAQTALKGISSEDAASLLEDLKSRNHVRNASAWICAKAKRFPQEQASPEFEDRQRSRSPRRGVINLTPIARQDEANDEMEKEYAAKVRTLVDESDIMLDEHAKAALKAVPGYQGLQVFHHVVQDTQGSIRNPSAFVVKKCREIAKQNGTESQFLKETNSACETREGQPAPIAARAEAERPEAPREASSGPALGGWRSMPLDQWLRSVDNGKGYLLQYEQGLLKNYDNLEQIMELYVAPPGDDGKISIDQTFFADLTAGSNVEMKVGHKRMFEKWFKDHWNS